VSFEIKVLLRRRIHLLIEFISYFKCNTSNDNKRMLAFILQILTIIVSQDARENKLRDHELDRKVKTCGAVPSLLIGVKVIVLDKLKSVSLSCCRTCTSNGFKVARLKILPACQYFGLWSIVCCISPMIESLVDRQNVTYFS
jgi:hypothetical protein